MSFTRLVAKTHKIMQIGLTWLGKVIHMSK